MSEGIPSLQWLCCLTLILHLKVVAKCKCEFWTYFFSVCAGLILEALILEPFKTLDHRKLVSWNAMIVATLKSC